jgi:hypothetical protein
MVNPWMIKELRPDCISLYKVEIWRTTIQWMARADSERTIAWIAMIGVLGEASGLILNEIVRKAGS